MTATRPEEWTWRSGPREEGAWSTPGLDGWELGRGQSEPRRPADPEPSPSGWTWWSTRERPVSAAPLPEWSWWGSEHSGRRPPSTRRPTTPGLPFRSILRRFAPYVRRRRWWFALSLLLAVLPPATEAAEIYLFKVVVDDVLVPRDFALLPVVAAAYLGLTVLGGAISSAQRMLSTWLSQRFLIEVRVDLLRHLQRLSLDFFGRSRIGDLLSRMTADVAAIEAFVLSAMTGFLTSSLQVLFFVAALFVLQWQLALVALVVTPSFWFISRRVSRRLKDFSRQRQQLSGDIGSVVEQGLSNVALVQAYGQVDQQVHRFRHAAEQKYRVEMASARLKSIYGPVADVVELVGVLLVIGSGAWLVTRGEISVGGLLAFLTFLTSLYGPIRQLGGLVNAAYSASAGAERVVELLDQRPAVADDDAADVGPIERIEVESVGFCYPKAAAPSLRDVSFSVARGETVALVGASGAGKSTLAKLLVRFYDPDLGRILVNGVDLRKVSLTSLRRNVSVLLQEALVFDGTIRDNIAYGRRWASEQEIVQAAESADAHDFIRALPEGYDTRVGERGRRLSGGQLQRIAIARAMLRDAPFLLLDEPSTGLDANAVEHLVGPLRRLMAHRSTILISHNLLMVREVDRIVVLDHGEVVEVGSHEDLLAAGGHYARLWRQSGLGSGAERDRAA